MRPLTGNGTKARDVNSSLTSSRNCSFRHRHPEMHSTQAAHTALGRLGQSDEIADAIARLASSELR
jgi:NAD(P)-dependent dehydrogenase (short-subunit alcohol dehydrogenase family)